MPTYTFKRGPAGKCTWSFLQACSLRACSRGTSSSSCGCGGADDASVYVTGRRPGWALGAGRQGMGRGAAKCQSPPRSQRRAPGVGRSAGARAVVPASGGPLAARALPSDILCPSGLVSRLSVPPASLLPLPAPSPGPVLQPRCAQRRGYGAAPAHLLCRCSGRPSAAGDAQTDARRSCLKSPAPLNLAQRPSGTRPTSSRLTARARPGGTLPPRAPPHRACATRRRFPALPPHRTAPAAAARGAGSHGAARADDRDALVL